MQSTPSELAPPDSTIIRTGSDGRLRYSPTQRQELLDGFDRSGISAMSFSRQHGIHYQTFIAWLRKRRENSSSSAVPGKPIRRASPRPTSMPTAPPTRFGRQA
jgi:transposase-like protein